MSAGGLQLKTVMCQVFLTPTACGVRRLRAQAAAARAAGGAGAAGARAAAPARGAARTQCGCPPECNDFDQNIAGYGHSYQIYLCLLGL